MTTSDQSIEALQQENQRLREQVAALTSERDQQNQPSQDTPERYNLLFQNMVEGTVFHEVVYDTEGQACNYRILDVNPAFERMLQIPRAAILGKVATEAYGTESAPFLDIYAGVAHTGTPEQFQTTFGAQVFDIRVTSPRRGEFVTMFFDITGKKITEGELLRFRDILNTTPELLATAPADTGALDYANPALCRMLGYTADEIIGMPVPAVFAEPPEQVNGHFRRCIESGTSQGELHCKRKDGSTFPIYFSAHTLFRGEGVPPLVASFFRDLTAQKQGEEERIRLTQQVIDIQRDALRELSTPLIPITDDVVIMPLIGTIDSGRAQMVMEGLLTGVAQHQAELVILDITGVQVVDTQVAKALVQVAQAVKLLGAQVMLTGIQPQIAQTLVHLGVELDGIITHGSLQAGIAAALHV
jgi:rsbT co-antagonist protein RsbR